jgi:hypothetical protein
MTDTEIKDKFKDKYKFEFYVIRNENNNPEGDCFNIDLNLMMHDYDGFALSLIGHLSRVLNEKLCYDFLDNETMEMFGSFVVESLWYLKNRYRRVIFVCKIDRRFSFIGKYIFVVYIYNQDKELITFPYMKDQSNEN